MSTSEGELLQQHMSNVTFRVSGTRSSIARWQYCLDVVNQWFGMTVGAMFVREHFPRDNRADVIAPFPIVA